MKVIGIGEIVLDIICVDGDIYNYTGGGTVFNVLANISSSNYKLIAYGSVGDDIGGRYAVESLKSLGINTEHILYRKGKCRRAYQNTINSNGVFQKTIGQTTCPICKSSLWDSSIKLKEDILDDIVINNNDIAIFDSIRKDKVDIARKLKVKGTKLFLDIGHISNLRYMSISELKNSLKLPFDIIQINGKVASFIKTRLKIANNIDFFKLLDLEMLIITNGEEGAHIFYNIDGKIGQTTISFEVTDIKDTRGAGDAFFAGIILSYLNNNGNIVQFLSDIEVETEKLVSGTLKNIGARGYIEKIKMADMFSNNNEICPLCGLIVRREKRLIRKKFHMQTTLDGLDKRLDDSLSSPFKQKLNGIITHLNGNILVVGTGASFTTALFIRECLNRYNLNINATAIKPRDIYNQTLVNIQYVLLCSYSGKSKDILAAKDYIKKTNPQIKIVVITQRLEDDFEGEEHILSYGINASTKERGFISVAGIIIPCYYFTNLFYRDEISFHDYIGEVKNKIEFEMVNIESTLSKMLTNKKRLIIDIFYDDFNHFIASDLESKFIESGVGRVSLHEKKDFSHGRFITFEKNKSDIQLYINLSGNKYERLLNKYLEKMDYENIIYLNGYHNDIIIQGFELLIKNQYLFNR
jgi:sugar/nucleoside kinase (ribokinase family)